MYKSGTIYLVSNIFCYCVLFLVVLFAPAGNFILSTFIGSDNLKYILENVNPSFRGLCWLTIFQLLKLLNGFAHAGLYYYNFAQISVVSLGQVAIFISIVCFRTEFRSKFMFSLLVG